MGKLKGGFYAVARGRQIGIYRTWQQCEEQITGFPNSRFKKFGTEAEARAFIEANRTPDFPMLGNLQQNITGGPAGEAASALLNLFMPPSTSVSPARKRAHSTTAAAQDGIHQKRSRFQGVSFDDVPVVYTDGACSKNGQSGSRAGYGVWWGDNHMDNQSGGVHGDQTNNRAELLAVIQAINKAIERHYPRLVVRTDSQLLINSMERWIEKWKRNGWRTADGKNVKNRDLLETLDNLQQMCLVKFEHVPGHAGVKGNEMADALARAAAAAVSFPILPPNPAAPSVASLIPSGLSNIYKQEQ